MTHAVAVPPIREAEYMRQVIEYAHLMRWKTYHPWTSIHSAAGWPDLACLRNNVLAMLEIKSDRGKVTRAQQEWIDALGRVEIVQSHIVRPADWRFVQELLR